MTDHNWISTAVLEQMARNMDVVEAACERMLVTPGDYGVVVTNNPDGTVTAELSADVAPMTVNWTSGGKAIVMPYS